MGKIVTRFTCPFCGYRHWPSLLKKPLQPTKLIRQIAAGFTGFQQISADDVSSASEEQLQMFFVPLRERLAEALQTLDKALLARGFSLEQAELPEEDLEDVEPFLEEGDEDEEGDSEMQDAVAQLLSDIDKGKI